MSRPARCGLVAMLLACACTAAAAASDFRGIEDLRLPKSMRVERMGQALRINGVETFAWQFHWSENGDRLAAHFAREWDGGLKRRRVGPWEVLSQRRGDWLLTVQAASVGVGQVHGWIAAARLFGALERGRSRGRPDLPMLPRTHVLNDVEASDLGRRSRTLLLLSEQSAAQNLDFYRAHYREQGFEPLAARALVKSAGGGSMVLVRGGEQLNLAVSSQAGRSFIAIVRVHP